MKRLTSLLALAALLLTGCPGPKAEQGDAFDLVKKRGKLIVGTDAGYVPFEVVEPDGSLTGFDVDLVHEVAKDLGVEVEIQNVAWAGIVGQLRTGRIDTIFSGMSITEERKQNIDFSEPYYHIGQVVVKRKADDRFKTWQELDDPQFTVATQEGTTGEGQAREKMPKAKLLRFPKLDAACLAVIQEKADAVVFDDAGLRKYVAQREEQDLEGLWEPFSSEPIGAAIRKDSPKLKAAIDATLARLKKDGRYDALVKQYFGDAPKTTQPSK